jgi:hypothetical protein
MKYTMRGRTMKRALARKKRKGRTSRCQMEDDDAIDDNADDGSDEDDSDENEVDSDGGDALRDGEAPRAFPASSVGFAAFLLDTMDEVGALVAHGDVLPLADQSGPDLLRFVDALERHRGIRVLSMGILLAFSPEEGAGRPRKVPVTPPKVITNRQTTIAS